jgi:hypothetical protein
MTKLHEIVADVTFIANLPDGLLLLMGCVDDLEVSPSETLNELKRALATAYAAAYRLNLEAAGWPDEPD